MSTLNIALDNLRKWENCDKPLAPLTKLQKNSIDILQEEISPSTNHPSNEDVDKLSTKVRYSVLKKDDDNDSCCCSDKIETYQELLQNYTALERRFTSVQDLKYTAYLDQLKSRRNECNDLCVEIENALEDFSALFKQYAAVSSKTNSLHEASEQLISDQKKLNSFNDSIIENLKYFKEVDRIMEKLESPTLSVNSEIFYDILDRIDANMEFIQNNDKFKESSTFLVKYRHCQSKAISLIQHHVFNQFSNATESILNPRETETDTKNSDAALALFYGRFQSVLPKVKGVLEQVESKSLKRQEYEVLLTECYQSYLSNRGMVLGPGVTQALNSVKER